MVKQPFFLVKTMVKATISGEQNQGIRAAPHHCLAPRASSWQHIMSDTRPGKRLHSELKNHHF